MRLHVSVAHLVHHCWLAHDVTDTADNAEKLGLLHGLKETLLAGSSTSHDLDGLLQGAEALLVFGFVLLELSILLVADFGCLFLCLRILGKIFLQLLNLSSVRSQVASQFLNFNLKFPDRVFGLADGCSLGRESTLPPEMKHTADLTHNQ